MNDLKFTGRLQSFLVQPDGSVNEEFTTIDCIERMAKAKGITHVEPNYPMHFEDTSISEINECNDKLGLKISGVALRYDQIFCHGELTSPNPKKRDKAIKLTNEAAEICKKLGGEVLTVWSTYDGFDYPFQADYAKAWKMIIEGLKEVAQANPDLKISIEYKPYEPRQFYFINDIGTTLLAIEDTKCGNIGLTLDFAHMLMKKENPAYSLALAAERERLFGIHLNDGYGSHDDGLMIGSVNLLQTIEFIYYMKKYKYDGVIFFDTFPLREDPIKECEQNIETFKSISKIIEKIGNQRIEQLISNRDFLETQKVFLKEQLLS